MSRLGLAALFIVIAVGAYPLEIEGIGLTGSVIWLGNADDAGGPSPINSSAGVCVPVGLSRAFALAGGVRAFAHDYEWTEEGRAVSTEIETRNAFSVISVLLDVEATLRFWMDDDVATGISVAPAFLFRFPTTAYGDAEEYRAAMKAYFLAAGRFFYPGVGLYTRWSATDLVALTFRARAYPPVLQRLSEPNRPFFDQMLVELSVTALFRLGAQDVETSD